MIGLQGLAVCVCGGGGGYLMIHSLRKTSQSRTCTIPASWQWLSCSLFDAQFSLGGEVRGEVGWGEVGWGGVGRGEVGWGGEG